MDKVLKDMEFIVELDKMKSIKRMTSLIGQEEREDDAQHSWHIALMAMTLEDYCDEKLDLARLVEMLLVHDIVEIYAGDTFAYDKEGYQDKQEREIQSAEKIFSMLEEEKEAKFRGLWDEFEAMETAESKFANALDRLQPILNNFHNQGGSWVEHGITRSQVMKRIEPIGQTSKRLYEYSLDLVDKAVKLAYIKED